ncbi:MAG TPA: acyltransferase [Polyangiaceae bacterium]|nr:acyltransferase [Polyangiaceae bacterium]
MKEKTFHIPSLDGIRALAFLTVFVGHAGLANLVPGGFGVTAFFFLSGYLITTLMRMEQEKNGTVSLKQFYLRRALRILPPFYLVLLVATVAAATGVLPGGVSYGAVTGLMLHAGNYWVILNGYSGPPSGTGVYWSLAVEEHFYLVFPLLFIVLGRYVPSRARQASVLYGLCVVVLLWRTFLVYALHVTTDRTYMGSDTRIDSILFGCALALHGNPVLDGPSRISEATWKWVLVPLGLAGLLFALLHRTPAFRETLRYSIQGVALTPLFIAAVRFPNWRLFRPLNTRAASFLGVLSYSLYLVHYSLLDFVKAHVNVHPVVQGGIALVASIGVAWTIYRYVEKPCAAIRRRLSAVKTT